MTNVLDVLRERGFLYQLTDEESMAKQLAEGPVTFYTGFDPTADSLHIGHLLPIMAMRWLQKYGHRPLALVGGGTALIGDPSGKTSARPISSKETIDQNILGIKGQLSRFLDFGEGKAVLVNNGDWLRGMNLIDFLRDIGSLFSVPRMLTSESVRIRIEGAGLSFLEFSYPLLQSYDFMHLCKNYGCMMQFGGQDQWGNIVAGVDLTRRMLGKAVCGATFPLLLKSDGTKFGKTAGGAVWLDSKRTSPFDYYQFWRNTADSDVQKLLGFFTTLPMDEVRQLASLPSPAINRAKEILAYEATALAHGHDVAIQAFLAAGGEFGFADPQCAIATSSRILEARDMALESAIPTIELSRAELGEGIGLLSLMVKAGLAGSNGEARRLVKGGAVAIDDAKMTDERAVVTADLFHDGCLTLKAGKKNRKRVQLA
ncbi:MAG: tyrosine--tRNA ligase [Victivallales bacterium]|nr:tyrosine--tRNA ligase [Victivallales bacterium]